MGLFKSPAMPTSKETVTIYLTEEVKQELAAIAQAEKRSLSFMGEQFILEGISRWKSDKAKREDKTDA